MFSEDLRVQPARERRGEILAELKKLRDKAVDDSNDWTTIDDEKWNELNEEFDRLTERIDSVQKRLRDAARQYYGGGTTHGPVSADPRHSRALEPGESCRSYMREKCSAMGRNDFDEWSGLTIGDCAAAMIRGPRSDLERRAMAEGTDSAGGFLTPTPLASEVIDLMRAVLVTQRAGARIVPLTSDQNTIATVATDPVAAWRSENAAVSETDPTVGSITLTPRSLACVTRVSRELAEDAPNFPELMNRMLAESFAREVDRVAMFGSGAPPEPQGIVGTVGIGQVDMGVNGAALTNYDPVIDAIRLLEDANTPQVTAAVMAPRTSAELAKLKDTTDQSMARPPKIADLPFLVTSAVPVDDTHGTAVDASRILLGDWSQLILGFRAQFRLQVLQERYSDNLQLGFLAWLRLDIAVEHADGFSEIVGIIPPP